MNTDALLIARFTHWELSLCADVSPYLGRCVAWARRADADRFTDVTAEELEELRTVVAVWYEALNNWLAAEGRDRPYRENLSILGNSVPHLHAHLIPRYERPVEAFGVTFTDPRPHHHYKPYERTLVPDEVIEKIRDALSEHVALVRDR